MDRRPETWEDRVASYAAFLVDQGRQSATIKSYVSAIKYVLKADDYSWNESKMLLQSITRACRIENDIYKARYPIRVGLLEIILFEINRCYHDQPYLKILYQTLFAISYYGLFRIRELTVGDHQLKACDVHIADNKDKILLIPRTLKTHGKESKPQEIKITRNYDKARTINFCPFLLMRTFMAYRGTYITDSEGFFIFRDGSGVAACQACKVLCKVLESLNLNPKLYDTHSFRIGKASDMLKCQIPISKIKQIGRWRSNAVFRYLRNY